MESFNYKILSSYYAQFLKLLEATVFVHVMYESGEWYYLIYILPDDKDKAFAASGECQDGDLWLRSELVNEDWHKQEYKSYSDALIAGLDHGYEVARDFNLITHKDEERKETELSQEEEE